MSDGGDNHSDFGGSLGEDQELDDNVVLIPQLLTF